MQAIPDLLRSAFLAAQKGAPGADRGYVQRMLDFIWGPLHEAMAKVRALSTPGHCMTAGSRLWESDRYGAALCACEPYLWAIPPAYCC